MSASTTNAGGGVGTYVEITLTPADRNIIASALRSDLAAECQQILTAPLPDREDVGRIRALLDVYARQIETLGWGDGEALIDLDCPTDHLDTVARDLPGFAIERSPDHRLAVCAVLEHFLGELHAAPGSPDYH
jgi:hypothetical protein